MTSLPILRRFNRGSNFDVVVFAATLFGLVFVDRASAQAQPISTGEAPVTIGFATGRTSYDAGRGVGKKIIEPVLRFDGTRWTDVGSRLFWNDKPDGAVRNEKGQRIQSPPDAPLAMATEMARVLEREWKTWHVLGEGANRTIGATGSWVSLEQCEPKVMLTRGSGGVVDRQLVVATRPLAAIAFARVPMRPDDPWRQFAVKRWRLDERKSIASIIEKWKERDATLSRSSMQPKSVDAALRSPLVWWRSLCAEMPSVAAAAAGEASGQRVCQIVARRRFDGRTDSVYTAEPVEYSALVQGGQSGPSKILAATIGFRSLEERGEFPDSPDEPLLVFKIGAEDYLLQTDFGLESVSHCVRPLRSLPDADAAVCFSTGC